MSAALDRTAAPPATEAMFVLVVGGDDAETAMVAENLAGIEGTALIERAGRVDRARTELSGRKDSVVFVMDDIVGRGLLQIAAEGAVSASFVLVSHAATRRAAVDKARTLGAHAGLRFDALRPDVLDEVIGLASQLAVAQRDRKDLQEENELLFQRLCELRTIDPLTELPSRAPLMDRVQRAVDHVAGSGSHEFALLMIDVDGYSRLADSLGEMVAETGLARLAERLTDCVRSGDYLARYGQDKFVVLVERGNASQGAEIVANRVLRATKTPFQLGDEEVYLPVRIGVTTSAGGYTRAEEVIRDARAAKSHAAHAVTGKRAEVFRTSMHGETVERVRLEMALRNAVSNGELRLHYQPIVALPSGELRGFEALARWQHPKHGLVSPAKFVPIAEYTGLIGPIGEWVMREAIRQMREWDVDFGFQEKLSVSVNVSALQLRDDLVVRSIDDMLERTGLPAHCLKVEFTESVLVEEPERVIGLLSQLGRRGVRVYVDDFGTGYSSLSYLQRFPVHGIKIDKAFVDPLDGTPTGEQIARTIMDLATRLDVDVVAEGIEQPLQAKILADMGCPHGQGYLFSKPMSPGDAFGYLARIRQDG